MSVSYLQSPDLYSSGFDPQWFIASSTESLRTNFRYRVQICDKDGFVLREFRPAKDPDYGTLFFDTQRTVENYLSYDIANLIAGTVGFQKGVNTFVKYYINVAEEYGASGAISVHASGNSDFKYAINSAQDFDDMIDTPVQERAFFAAGVQSATFLTNQPASIKIKTADSYELGFISGTPFSSPDHMRIKTYDSSGNLLKSSEFDNAEKANTTDAQRFLSMLVGPGNINSWTVASGSAQPLIADNVYKYEVSLETSADALVSEVKTFIIDRSCTRSGTYNRLYWLNPLGRFDAFNFTQMGEDSIEVEQSRYSRVLGVKTASTLTYTKSQVESSVFHSEIKQNYKLRSGFIDSETSLWLKELIASPRVYMIIGGSFVPVNLKTPSYTAKTTLQEKLFNVEIEVELSVPNQRQRL